MARLKQPLEGTWGGEGGTSPLFLKTGTGSKDLAAFVQGQPQELQAWAKKVPLVLTNHSGRIISLEEKL